MGWKRMAKPLVTRENTIGDAKKARRKLSPFVSMQQLVDVVQQYILAQPTTKCGMEVLGGKEISGLKFHMAFGP